MRSSAAAAKAEPSQAEQECFLCADAQFDTHALAGGPELAEQLQPVSVRLLFDRHSLLRDLPLQSWKMNLLAAAPDGHSLFVGSNSNIIMLPLSAAGIPRVIEAQVPIRAETLIDREGTSEIDEREIPVASTASPMSLSPRDDEIASLFHVLTLPMVESADADFPAAPAELNTLRVGYVGWRPVLAAACMSGHSCLFDLQRLSHVRFGPGACPGGSTDPDLFRLNLRPQWRDNSAWSLALSPRGCRAPVVAIGSNAARAFLWKPAAAESDAEIAAAERATYVPAGHNVPSVDISSCGRFLALSCIDTMLRVARIDGGKYEAEFVAIKDVDALWGWSVRWIPRWAVRQRTCTLAQMQQHRQHAPISQEVQRLHPFQRAPPPAAGANPMLEHMVTVHHAQRN